MSGFILTQICHKKKQQKNPGKLARIVNTGRPLKINELIEEQKHNVNAAEMIGKPETA